MMMKTSGKPFSKKKIFFVCLRLPEILLINIYIWLKNTCIHGTCSHSPKSYAVDENEESIFLNHIEYEDVGGLKLTTSVKLVYRGRTGVQNGALEFKNLYT